MNPILLFFEIALNYILFPIWWIIGCIGYIYDWFACKNVPVPKKILVTGASSGIGRATAIEYAKEVGLVVLNNAKGITLVLIGRNVERLEEVAKVCREKGSTVITFVCDLREKEKMEKFLIEEDEKAPIDLVLASAGVMIPQCGSTEDYAVVTRELYSINIDGTFNTILPLLPRMQKRRSGQIALFSSGAGLCSQPMNPIYSSTKVTLMAYGESLRFIMRDYNVYVSIVSPGAIRTPMTEVPHLSAMQSSLASPEGMAKAIVYGLKRDFMHIGYTTAQYFAVSVFFRDMPATVKDFFFRAFTPFLKKTNQYLIEFHPDPARAEQSIVCYKQKQISQSFRIVFACEFVLDFNSLSACRLMLCFFRSFGLVLFVGFVGIADDLSLLLSGFNCSMRTPFI